MNDVALEAEEVATREFPVGFRGYGQHEVRAFLAQVAAELAATRERERLQRERLEAAEARAASRPLTDEEIEAALGREAGRVLQAAREAAAEIRTRAEEQVARLVRDASGEGSRAQQEAESLLARRTEEAEQEAAQIRADAETQARAEVDQAKTEGREMVAEAQAVRERVLKDLARRRRVAHQQLEQLRAGRERLLEAYRVVRTTLDEATRELSVAEAEARAAAERASLRAASQPETSVEELEAELAGARDIGLSWAPTARFVGASNAGNGWGRDEPEVLTEPEVAEAEPGALAEPEVAESEVAEPEVAEPEVAEPEVAEPEVEVVDVVDLDLDLDLEPAPAPEHAHEPEPEAAEAPVAAEAPETEPEPEHALGALLVSEPDVEAAPELEPRAEAEEPTAPDPEAHEEPEPEPAIDPEVQEAVEGGAVVSGPGSGSQPEGQRGVEELFARLRAERAAGAGAAAPTGPVIASGPHTGANGATPASAPSPPAEGPDDEDVLQARDAEIEDIERSLAKALKRALADEQNEVLDTIRRSRGGVGLVDLLPSPSDHTARFLAVAGPELQHATGRGLTGDQRPPSSDDLAVGLAAMVADDLRDRLQRALEVADGDEAPLVEAISAAYREWKTARIEPLARHHVVAAHARGRFASSVGRLRWVVDAEEGPCPDCDDNALAGAIDKGEPFPTGQHHPPAHVGCRCALASESVH